MQLPQKSKHNNSAFKKWMQILAGKNSSEATTERQVKIQREQQRRRRQQPCPQQREHRFAQRRRSRRQETEERLQRLQTAVVAVFFRCLCIQFNSILFECRGTKYRNYNANKAD